MASLLRTLTYTTGSIAAGASTSRNDTIVGNSIEIYKIKVAPSNITTGELTQYTIYQHNTFLAADIAYDTTSFNGNLVDPISTDGVTSTERNGGFVAFYEDLDGALQLHNKIINNGTAAKTYTVTIKYRVLAPLPTYADNAAAIADGAPVGSFFKTGSVTPEIVCVVI